MNPKWFFSLIFVRNLADHILYVGNRIDRLLRYDLLKPFEAIQMGSEMLKNESKRFEPENQLQNEGFWDKNPLWGDRRDLNPQPSVPQTDALPLSYDHQDMEIGYFLWVFYRFTDSKANFYS